MAARLVMGALASMALAGFATLSRTGAEAGPTAPQLGGVGNVTLKPETLAAFEQYVKSAEARMDREIAGGKMFLAVDSLPAAERDAAYSAMQSGETHIEQTKADARGGAIECPAGMIHHWTGIVFIRGANLEGVLRLMQDYDRAAQVYAPDVVRARLISHTGDDFKVFMRLRRQNVITVTLDTEHNVHYTRLDGAREMSRSISTSVREVASAGKSDEHDLAPDTGGGYLWRINSYWRFLQRDGGVYVQCESISLTRDIPTGLGWMIGPFVTSIPKESLAFTLDATRKALQTN